MADPRDKMRRLWPFAWVDTDDKASWEMQEHETGLYITVDDPALIALIEERDDLAAKLEYLIEGVRYDLRYRTGNTKCIVEASLLALENGEWREHHYGEALDKSQEGR